MMRPVVVLPPVSAFGGSFNLPVQLRQIPLDLARTSLTTRDPAAIAQAAQDYIDLANGRASAVTTLVPQQTMFTGWKRNPYTSGATKAEYQGPAASVPGYMAARSVSPATVALMANGVAGLRGLSGLGVPPQVNIDQMADVLGANVVRTKPRTEGVSPVRLRPIDQRNTLPISPMAPLELAREGHRPSERENATGGILSEIGQAMSNLLRGF